MKLDPSHVARFFAAAFPELPQTRGDNWRTHCPFHEGAARDSFSVSAETGAWLCFACDRKGGAVEFLMARRGLTKADALKEVRSLVGLAEPEAWRDTAVYPYLDSSGALLYEVVRRERGSGAARQKTFAQRRPDGRGGWVWNLKGVKRVPYRLPRLAAADRVFIVEGEKDVHTLEQFGLVATCNSGGAGKWRSEYAEHFREKVVIVIPDNDRPGRAHALDVAENVLPLASSLCIVSLPGLPEKGDVSDWIDAGGDLAGIEALIGGAPTCTAAEIESLRRQWGNSPEERKQPDQAHAGKTLFRVLSDGVYFQPGEPDAEPIKLCGRLEVSALTRTPEGNDWGIVLQWEDVDGTQHSWVMPKSLLAGDGAAIREQLLSGGLFVSPSRKARELLLVYLQTTNPTERARCVSRVGWHDGCFVLPDFTVVPDA
jgi:hypothetical protein